MLFNTINYFLFLIAVFILYYSLPARSRWLLLLAASIFFYMAGSAATIVTPIIITAATYFCGILIDRAVNDQKKKRYFLAGLVVNVGLLVFFKYTNFFIATAFDGFNFLNHLANGSQTVDHHPIVLNLLIPLGISYITFSAIAYLIEIKRGNEKAETHFGLFATYILFFPKLLSGPIERAQHFIPQLHHKHTFDYENIAGGLKRILRGLFLKLVIASRLEIYTGVALNNPQANKGLTLFVATIFYTLQLYADFSGYTDMAIGSARLFGYRLMENFNQPFKAKSVTEFWRRWHISLSSWVNEYIYNPVAITYRNWNKWAVIYAGMVTFLILGFWHGASWNYIVFGFLQGFILAMEFLTRKLRKNIRGKIPLWLNTFLGTTFTFCYFSFSLIFFRDENLAECFTIIKKISAFDGPWSPVVEPDLILYPLLGVVLLILIENNTKLFPKKVALFYNRSWLFKTFVYAVLLIVILLIGVFDGGQFIYVHF